MFSERTSWELSTNRFTQAIQRLRAEGVPLLDLTLSNPTECGLTYDTEAILAAFQDPRALCYDPQPKGLLGARQHVARYYLEDHHIEVDPESIFLTTGTSEAYSFIFRLLCDAHDEILVPKPSYPLFDFLAGLHDVRLVPYSLEYAQGWLVDFQSLLLAITPRTRAVLLVHPNNPTGSYLRRQEIERLNAICSERKIALIVDEVFLDYPFDRVFHKSFASNGEVLTFALSGLSKISALPQMKVAWLACAGPEPLVRAAAARLEVIADTYLSLNAPTQWAIGTLLDQRKSLQGQLGERVRTNLAQVKQLLANRSRVELLDADGGWYAVLRVRSVRSDEELAIGMIEEQRVVVHPGHFFDFASDGFLVASLITPVKAFKEGVERLVGALD